MKNLLIILIVLITAVGCTPKNKVIEVRQTRYTSANKYVVDDIPCDSLEYSMKDFPAALLFKNLKINETTFVIVSEHTSQQYLKQKLKSKDWNKIDVSSLKKGIYYIEWYDYTGIVYRNIFIRK